MKKIFLLLIATTMFCASRAQIVEKDEAALVYYAPKTLVSIDFSYKVETHEVGMFAEFAEAMLGVDDGVTDHQTIFRLTNAHIGTRTVTDFSRPHKVDAEQGMPLLLSIDEKGLLTGYNLPADVDKAKKKAQDRKEAKPKTLPVHVYPFPEEVMEAATPLAQAHAVAKQIFHLRETKMYLLSGEVEHAPADGAAMKLVLDELDRQEQSLTELFVGKKSERIEHKQVLLDPEQEEMLLFFSSENGFTDAENIDADTIRVSVALQRQELKSSGDGKKKKKGAELSQIVYNLLGSGDVKIEFDGHVMAERKIPVAQAGIDVPLPMSLFTGAELPVIRINEKTGNIESISK